MEQIIEKFGLDWRLLIANAVNFTILFYILHKFVYKPILGVLAKRREDIEKGIEFSKKAEENLKNADALKEATLKDAKDKALSIVSQAESAGNDKKNEIIKAAEVKKEQIIADARVVIDGERDKMMQGVYASAEGLLQSALSKILGKMDSKERDKELVVEALRAVKHSNNK